MKTTRVLIALVFASCALASPALAHTGHGAEGLHAGLAHPFAGLDHLLAMAAVGVWASLQPARKAWAAPALFVAMLAVGALAGIGGIDVPFVEPGILTSVVLLGVMIATGALVPASLGLAMIGAFALLHGHAHGTEAVGGAAAYIGGFIVSSAMLHLGGYVAGSLLSRVRFAVPAAGLAIAAAGAVLAAG